MRQLGVGGYRLVLLFEGATEGLHRCLARAIRQQARASDAVKARLMHHGCRRGVKSDVVV
jgi:hypothetical protein